MRTYGQFCPVSKAAEVFAERWTPLILRELFDGSRRFSEIHAGVPRMSRSLLAQRLRSLEADGVIERRELPGERGPLYYPTPAGAEFAELVELLGAWGQRWMADLHADELDSELLMIALSRRVRREELPDHRVVLQFDFRDEGPASAARSRYWLVLERADVEVCYKDPGYEPNLYINTDLRTMIDVHLGRLAIAQATRGGQLALEGPRWAVRGFGQWIEPSPSIEWEHKWAPRMDGMRALLAAGT